MNRTCLSPNRLTVNDMFWNSKNWLIAPWMILFIQATKDRQSVIHNFPFLILEIKYV